MKEHISHIITFFIFFLSLGIVKAETKPNVILITVDDLRPELNCYGATHMITPNIDRIANQGMRFESAYVQSPACGPSRTTTLSGVRVSGWEWGIRPEQAKDEMATLPKWFKLNGYKTYSLEKVYHYSDDDKNA